MKDDVEVPDEVPKKRRQLEQALDLWLAVWAARDDLTPSERRRVQEERDRRKALVPRLTVGFTGSRAGMTPKQKGTVRRLLKAGNFAEARHGDCVGADETFHTICRANGVPVVLHPPVDGKLRAFCKGAERSENALPYLERNKEIVKAATVMIATPKEQGEPRPARGQGTWSTVRYARTRGVPVTVVMPDGSIHDEGDA